MPRCRKNGCRGGGVRAIGVQHDRDPHWTKKAIFDRLEDHFTRGHITATNKDGRVVEIFGATSKHATVDQTLNLIRFDFGMTKQLLNIGIHRDDRVKNTALLVGVQLNQNLRFAHHGPL